MHGTDEGIDVQGMSDVDVDRSGRSTRKQIYPLLNSSTVNFYKEWAKKVHSGFGERRLSES